MSDHPLGWLPSEAAWCHKALSLICSKGVSVGSGALRSVDVYPIPRGGRKVLVCVCVCACKLDDACWLL